MDRGSSITGSVRAGVDDAPRRTPLQQDFADALARWASGVAVVAVRNGPSIAAITATSFASVSLDPPMILVCVGADATVRPLLGEGERFGVSILAGEQRRLASVYAERAPLAREAFTDEDAPVVENAIAGLGCTVRHDYAGGDHRIIVGEVDRVAVGPDEAPLVYFRREYRGLS